MSAAAAKVLIADDEDNILISIEFLLRQAGFEVVLAHDGEEAGELVRSERPDLVILDVMMPHKDGFQVCQEIREDANLAGIKIIILTAKGRDSDTVKGLALGADAYMVKPFSTRELVAQVSTLLGTAPTS